jgi:hypothetical protein
VASRLLRQGANPDHVDSASGYSPGHIAREINNLSVMQFFPTSVVRTVADIFLIMPGELDRAQLSVTGRRRKARHINIERGVDPMAENRRGRTFFKFAEHLTKKYPEELER